MAKVALLIGVSEYEPGLAPLPGAVKDIEAMQRVLQHSEMGRFDHVETLPNPEPIVMQERIEALFADRSKDDLVLLFFSGHGVKDERGRLYFATHLTRKTLKGDLVKATAVPAGFVQDVMSNSRCRRQVVVLDCCFSGAFAEGMTAKDDGTVDVQSQLGGEGRVVLTSSTATQYSFEQQNSDLSVYTRYIVEGIETGAADADQDGRIAIDELHEYARRKVQESAPAMKPKIYAVEEGFRIHLAQAPTHNPELTYRREVEACISRGDISTIQRYSLDSLQRELGLSSETAASIESEVLRPIRERRQKLQQYRQILTEVKQREKVLSQATRQDLKQLQKVLRLRNEDVDPIEQEIMQSAQTAKPKVGLALMSEATSSETHQTALSQSLPHKQILLAIGGLIALVGISWGTGLLHPNAENAPQPSAVESPAATPDTTSASTPVASVTPEQNSLTLYQQGVAQIKQGQIQAGIDTLTQAIELNKDWGSTNPQEDYYGAVSAYIKRGEAYNQLNQNQNALADFQQAGTMRETSVNYYNEGIASYKLSKKQEAFEYYNRAINLNEVWYADQPEAPYYGLASAFYNRALVRAELGDPKGAIEDYQKAADLHEQKGVQDWADSARQQIKLLQGSK